MKIDLLLIRYQKISLEKSVSTLKVLFIWQKKFQHLKLIILNIISNKKHLKVLNKIKNNKLLLLLKNTSSNKKQFEILNPTRKNELLFLLKNISSNKKCI